MDDNAIDCYLEAGKLARDILAKGSRGVRAGASYLAVVETIEAMVRDAGAGLAFPLNVSVNEDAAHDTASAGDERCFSPGDMVKVDLGVHLDGYIADTAVTVDLGDHPLLVEASREALSRAIELVCPGIFVGELGGAIQQAIESRGFRPVMNLTGHGLGRYAIHTSPSIPNILVQGGAALEEGMVFAIEPFASTGAGQVGEKHRTEIFQQLAVRPVRLPSARRILEEVRARRGMPFARRWLSGDRLDIPLTTLVRAGIIRAYPVLADSAGSFVSQHEHTVIVISDGCLVTTS